MCAKIGGPSPHLTARDVPARAEAAHRVVERELVRVCVEKEVEEGGDDDGEDLEDGHLDLSLIHI